MVKINVPLSKSLLSAALSISLFTTGCGNKQEQASAPQALPVQLETIETANLVDSSEFVGTLRATQRVTLAPKINGRIIEIFVPSGSPVSQGTPIVLLEPNQQEEQVNARKSQVLARQAELGAAQTQLNTAKAQKAQAAAQLGRAKSDLQNAQAELDLAKVNYGRAQFLVTQGVQPQQDLDDKTRDINTKRAQRDAQQEIVNAQEQALKAAEEGIKQAEANIKRAEAEVASAEAEVGVVSVDLQNNEVLAPIDGVVGDYPVKIGDYVNIGQELTTLTNNEEFDLRIFVPIERQSQLGMGLPVEIIGGDGTPGLRGELTFISPTVDQNTQSILTKATFENDGSLQDDQFVRVRIIWNEKPGVLVPTVAVTSLGGQKFVFVAETAEGNSTLVAKQTPVKLGSIQGQAYQVISGIEPGDKVAISRILDLSDGRPIQEEAVQSQKN